MRITDLPTPQVVVDRRRLERNIERMQRAATEGGPALRPHSKTHKIPAIARMQLDRGAVGICCAKVGEAEVFVDAGIRDVRLPYPVHPSNAARLLPLMDRARMSIIVDHPRIAEEWSAAMRHAGRTLDVLVKVDVGYHRCGVDPSSAETVPFIERLSGLPGLRFRGLLSHAGQAYHAEAPDALSDIAAAEASLLRELADAVRARGVAVDETSVGATPLARLSATQPGVTELRPGNYVYFDRSQVAFGVATLDDCALTIVATVVSKPAGDRLVLDCGSKTLTSDVARGFRPPAGHGAVLTDLESTTADPALLVERLSEEHAVVRVLDAETRLEPGDRVRVVPNHSCVVSNLVDAVHLVDGLEVVDTLPVAARGRIA